MKLFDDIKAWADDFQRNHHSIGFTYAVIKRYNEDKTSYQAAMLTYYGFLALFPLLLVATTLASIIAASEPNARAAITTSLNGYFPVLGNQLSEHVLSIHKSGIPLIIGLLIALYGARGVIDVFRRGVRSIWHEEIDVEEDFPKAQLKSIGMVLIGGLGLLAASVLSGIAAGVGHGILFRLFSIVVNLGILTALFTYLMNASLPHHVPFIEIRAGAIAAAIGLVIMQTLGGFVLTHELRTLGALYSTFAISLGLIFWLYLQSQVMYYAVTAAMVGANKEWPRGLDDKYPTAADKRVAKAKKL